MQGTGQAQGFWSLLSEGDRAGLSALGPGRVYPSDATLCVEGDPTTHLFILTEGWVKIISTTRDGYEIVLALRGPGDIVGEIAGAATGRRNATVRAINTVRSLIVSYDKFNAFLNSHPSAEYAFRRVVTKRWNDTDSLLRSRSTTTGMQRLAGLLLDLADRHGREIDGAMHLVMPLSQEELASLAGTSRATITRAFSTWRQRGIIRTGTRRVEITNLRALRRIAARGVSLPDEQV